MEDPMEEYRERRYINIWSAQEKQIFKEKYLQHPKNFALISSFLEKKVSHRLMASYFLIYFCILLKYRKINAGSSQSLHCLSLTQPFYDSSAGG